MLFFAEYFRIKQEQKTNSLPTPSSAQSLQNQINNLRTLVVNLEARLNSFSNASLASLEPNLFRSQGVPDKSYSFAYPRNCNIFDTVVNRIANTEIPDDFFPEQNNEFEACSGMEEKTSQPNSLLNPDEFPCTKEIEKESIKAHSSSLLATKLNRLEVQHLWPGAIQSFNHSGGVIISDSKILDEKTINQYFSELLCRCYILRFENRNSDIFYISGKSDNKPTQEFRLARIYDEGESVRRGLLRATKNFSSAFEKLSALEFLLSLPLSERENLLRFWNIGFEFCPE